MELYNNIGSECYDDGFIKFKIKFVKNTRIKKIK